MDLARIPALSDSRRVALYTGACTGLIAFSLALVWTATTAVVLPWYEPLRHVWIWSAVKPSDVSMDFFARAGLGALAALVLGGIGAFVATKRAPPPAILRALGVWALGATLLGMALYAWALGTRVIEIGR